MVHPSAMTWGAMLLRETLILLTFMLTVFTALEIRHGPTTKRVVLLGVAYALLIHTDSRFLFYAPFLALYVLLPRRAGGWGWRPAFLLTLVVLLLTVPWTIRNFIAYHELVLIDTRTLGLIQMKGTNDPGYLRPPPEVAAIMRRHGVVPADNVQSDQPEVGPAATPDTRLPAQVSQIGVLDKASSNFKEFWRICRFKESYEIKYRPPWSRVPQLRLNSLLRSAAALDCVGSILSYRRDRAATLVLVLPILGHTLLHIFAPFSNTRYRLPIELPMILVSMYALTWIFSRAFSRKQGR